MATPQELQNFTIFNMESVRLVRVSTTSSDEEDFLLVTDLLDDEIQDIVTPIVEAERENPQDDVHFYDNEGLIWSLKDHYPNNLIIQYTIDNLDLLTI
jgi:hypothetical protein